MRLSDNECLELYRAYHNPYIRRLTNEEYNRLAEKHKPMKRWIAKQKEISERRNHVTEIP